MQILTRLRRDAHVVDHGSVPCPVRLMDVDVEDCLACSAFTDLIDEGNAQYLVCKPVPRTGFGAFTYPSA